MGFKNRASFRLEQLSRMQLYVGEEMVEKYEAGLITWGQMLRSLVLVGGSAAAAAALLAASSDTPPTPPGNVPSLPVFVFQPPTGPLVVPEDEPTVKAAMQTFGSGNNLNGYLAQPAEPGSYPGVIVIHEVNSLSDHIKDVARRLAKAGFIAFAPDLLARYGITSTMPIEKVFGLMGNAKPEEVLTDLNTAVDFLAQQPNVTGKLGVVGFCFGGGYSLNLAAVNPQIKAAICYYGVMPQELTELANTHAAILAHYAGKDARVNASVPALEEALGTYGKTFEKFVYEGAVHAFNNDNVATFFNEEAAVTAWHRSLDWFNLYLR